MAGTGIEPSSLGVGVEGTATIGDGGTLDDQHRDGSTPLLSSNLFVNKTNSTKGMLSNASTKRGKKGKKSRKGGAAGTGYVLSSQTASILKNNFLK